MQVSLCAIYRKLKDAHRNSNSSLTILEWLDKRCVNSEMFYYWRIILQLEIEMLIFIRSFREGNFQLYFESLLSLLKWYFAIDKYNYARWATVHWFDLAKLQDVCPSIYSEMTNGYFLFQKTNRKFSRMALDQIHEQNNKDIKGVSGATNLLNRVDDSGLSRWELCGPDLVRLVNEFENNGKRNVKEGIQRPHHEEMLKKGYNALTMKKC